MSFMASVLAAMWSSVVTSSRCLRWVTWAVMVFLEYIRPWRSVMGWLLGGLRSLGRHTAPPPSGISTARSMNSVSAVIPWASAAP